MKRTRTTFILLTTLLISFLLYPTFTKAKTADINGGIQNEYTYEEVVFISGKPIKFTGTSKNVKVNQQERNGKLTQNYQLTLKGANVKDTLTRNFTYVSDVTNYDKIGQSTANGEVTRYTETTTIDGMRYTLSDYQLSKGTVTDKRPASDYFSGNAIARKTYTYTIPKTKEQDSKTATITVNVDSKRVGYENFWGATETQITNSEIIYDNGSIGHVKNIVSSTKSRELNYEENAASLSSFAGGYAVVSSANAISKYEYTLPKLGSGAIDLNAEYMPRIERLIVPKFRDLSNHWAKDEIEKLYSLGIFNQQTNFFSPNTPMTRWDFTIAVGKAVDLRVLEEDKKSKTNPSIFEDVSRTVEDYNYLVSAVDKGIIKGSTPTTFSPNGSITRQQAAAIFVRALGLENKAPDPGFKTNYKDDHRIDDYARDGVYVVTELGLMSGDSVTGRFNPKSPLTRAQAAAVIVRFLEYLENDLKQNYREDILFFE